MGFYSSNEPILNFESLTNQSYPVALEIIFYMGFLIAFAVKSSIIPLHTWLPNDSWLSINCRKIFIIVAVSHYPNDSWKREDSGQINGF